MTPPITHETMLDDHESETVVPTIVGDLGAVLRVPPGTTAAPLPGVVLVDGSGDGDRYDWGGWPGWIADAGSVVLRHDKPGCGGSPGHWTDQTLEDRAKGSLDAVRVLREHPATAGQPVGLYGISQGGWVALLAAALEPDKVDFIVCHSGPGTTPAQQERDRIEAWLREAGHDDAIVADGLGLMYLMINHRVDVSEPLPGGHRGIQQVPADVSMPPAGSIAARWTSTSPEPRSTSPTLESASNATAGSTKTRSGSAALERADRATGAPVPPGAVVGHHEVIVPGAMPPR